MRSRSEIAAEGGTAEGLRRRRQQTARRSSASPHPSGRVDGLVLNAAICPFGEDWQAPDWDESFERVMNVNVLGPIHAARAFLPGMIERRHGRIVMVGSLAGRMGGLIAGPHYVASKGGLHALVKWLARQAAPHGVIVNGVAPASVETPMMEGQPVDIGRIPRRSAGAAGGGRLANRLSLFARGELHLRRRARRERRRLHGVTREENKNRPEETCPISRSSTATCT